MGVRPGHIGVDEVRGAVLLAELAGDEGQFLQQGQPAVPAFRRLGWTEVVNVHRDRQLADRVVGHFLLEPGRVGSEGVPGHHHHIGRADEPHIVDELIVAGYLESVGRTAPVHHATEGDVPGLVVQVEDDALVAFEGGGD